LSLSISDFTASHLEGLMGPVVTPRDSLELL